MTIRSRCFCWISAWVLIAGFNANAQKPDWIRNSVMAEGANGDTNAKRVAVHPDGSVYVLGQYNGSNIFNDQLLTSSPNNTIDDAFLARYNANGDLIWIKQLFQSQEWYSNRVLDLKVDHEGNLVFSGSCLWPSSILGSPTGTGTFIAKIDKEGALLWLNFQPITGSIAEHDVGRRGNRIGFDPDHNILWFTDQISEFAPSGGLAVTRYKSDDGTKLATMYVTRNPTFYRPGMQDFSVDEEGNFIISGNFQSTVAFTGGPSLSNNGSNYNPVQFFVAKFASDGKFLWVVHSNYASNVVTSHTVDQDGNAYVGLQIDAGSLIYTPHGTINVTGGQRSIARITADGRLDWMNPVVFTNVEDIFLAPDGLLYVTGISFGEEFRYQSYVRSKSGDAAFILKVNTEGNFHGLYLGEPQDEPSTLYGSAVYGYQSVVDTDGNIYTIGSFWEGQVWGCVPAVTKEHAFYLVKHMPVDSPVRTIEGPELVCDSTEITLITDLISNGVLYKWFTPDNVSPGPGVTLKNSITMIAKKEYNRKPVIVSITDACDEYFAEPYILNVMIRPEKPQLTVRTDTVCPETSEEYKIAVTETGATYQWTLAEGISAPSLTDEGGTFIFNSDFIEGEVKISVTNFCGSAETIFTIGTYKTPGVPVLTGDEEICPDDTEIFKSIELVAYAVSYQWELPPHIIFYPFHPNNGNTLYGIVDSNFQVGEIKVRAVGHCKTSEASLPIIIKRAEPPGTAESITGPDEICTTDDKVRYSIPPIENVAQYLWTIPDMFDRNGTVITSEPYIDLKAEDAGTGELFVYGATECYVNTGQVSIPVITYKPLEYPVLEISDCDYELVVRDAEDFSWYFNGILAPQFSGNNLVLSDSGTYYVVAENFCGVRQSNVIQAYPVLTSRVLIPNVITPNGDGKNDFFMIDKSLSNSDVNVMNRWGESVYSSLNYKNNWSADGLASGTYFLTIRNKCLPHGYKGWLMVIKD